MKNKKDNVVESQGEDTTKERNPSLSYTIKSLAGNIKKLKQLKATSNEEIDQMIKIHKNLLNKYIGGELDF